MSLTYLIYSPIAITHTQNESLQLEQGALQIQVKTIIWTQKITFNLFQMWKNVSSRVIQGVKIVPVDFAAELPGK